MPGGRRSRHFALGAGGIDRPACVEGHCGESSSTARAAGRASRVAAAGGSRRSQRPRGSPSSAALTVDVRIRARRRTSLRHMHMDDVADVHFRLIASPPSSTSGTRGRPRCSRRRPPPHQPRGPGPSCLHGDVTDTHYFRPPRRSCSLPTICRGLARSIKISARLLSVFTPSIPSFSSRSDRAARNHANRRTDPRLSLISPYWAKNRVMRRSNRRTERHALPASHPIA